MTQKEIKQQWTEIVDNFNREMETKKQQLAIDFAKANTKFSIGDIVEDFSNIKIRVDKIRYSFANTSGMPEAVYEGFTVLKSGKNGKKRDTVYQSNALRFKELAKSEN